MSDHSHTITLAFGATAKAATANAATVNGANAFDSTALGSTAFESTVDSTAPLSRSGVDHCIAHYDSCSIAREASGEYLVRHGAFPGQRWVAANLPTAHALCTELRTRQSSR